MPQVGDQILHYEILTELGKGGMGQVFRALDTKLDREVALKFLLNQDQLNEGQKERLIIEAKAVAKLDHNNIGVLHAIEQVEDQLFLAMALYEGESLDERLKQGVFEIIEASNIIKQILEGLHHAHSRSVIHRDIKPANVFQTTEGVVKILDFGLARMPDSELTQHGQLIGTPSYISPEQFKAEGVDHRTDIWSLGVLLFQMLTGELPFEGKFPQVMVSILKEDPKSLSDYLNHEELQRIVEKCLAKDKLERFNNCDALLTSVRGIKQEEAVFAVVKPAGITPSRSRTRQLVGRESELGELRDLLLDQDTFLLTIAGIGGSGKTSLAKALILNRELLEAFPDGVHFVALDALLDAQQVPYTIANTMGVQLKGQYVWQELGDSLNSKTSLLVLDNLEHLIQDCAVKLEELISSCPSLSILATSREVLNIEGEVVYDLKGLSIPPDVEADFTVYGATELFINKAKRLKRSFDVNSEKEPILSICQQLEGWPLGIELAVAWVRQLSGSEISERLQKSLDFLTSRSRTTTQRHLSARSAFEYSWQLLSSPEQAALAKLSVFRGGFTSEAADNVTQTKLPVLALLMDKSLLTVTAEGRYDRHPLIFEFTQEKLASQEDAASIHDQHAAFFLNLAFEAKPHLTGKEQVAWFNTLAAEHDNLIATLTYLETQDHTQALRLAADLYWYWRIRGHYHQGLMWLQRLREQLRVDEQLDLRAEALFSEGTLTRMQGHLAEANALFEESLSLYRQLGDQQGIAFSLNSIGIIAAMQGNHAKGKVLFEESLSLKRQLGDQHGIADSLSNLGVIARDQGLYDEAKALYEESLSLRRQLGDQRGIADSLINLGVITRVQGLYYEAKVLFEESLSLKRQLGDQLGIAASLGNLGHIAQDSGYYDEAKVLYEEGLTLFRQLGDQRGIAKILNILGVLARDQELYTEAKARHEESLSLYRQLGDQRGIAEDFTEIAILLGSFGNHQQSITLFAASQALCKQLGEALDPQVIARVEHSLAQLREVFDEERFDALWDAGLKLSMSEAVELALTELRSLSV